MEREGVHQLARRRTKRVPTEEGSEEAGLKRGRNGQDEGSKRGREMGV